MPDVLQLVFGLIGIFGGTAGIIVAVATHRERRRHRATAYGCRYWTGDRHPLDLGTCKVCHPTGGN